MSNFTLGQSVAMGVGPNAYADHPHHNGHVTIIIIGIIAQHYPTDARPMPFPPQSQYYKLLSIILELQMTLEWSERIRI